jgi:hypothetical protein
LLWVVFGLEKGSSDLHRASFLPAFSDVSWNQLLLAPEPSSRVAFFQTKNHRK